MSAMNPILSGIYGTLLSGDEKVKVAAASGIGSLKDLALALVLPEGGVTSDNGKVKVAADMRLVHDYLVERDTNGRSTAHSHFAEKVKLAQAGDPSALQEFIQEAAPSVPAGRSPVDRLSVPDKQKLASKISDEFAKRRRR